jgi:hypothetical protein
MRTIKHIILFTAVFLGSSCSLDKLEDPNAVQPNKALPNLILNSMQRNFAAMYHTASVQGMSLTRLQNSGGALYNDVFNPQSFDFTWNTAYASLLQDGQVLIKDADERGYARHAGIARVFTAYTIMLLVDSFGDVPYTDAFKGANQFNPKVDKQADLYNLAITTLDKAIQDLTTTSTVTGGYLSPSAPVVEDLYYGNTFSRWARLANTLKLKLYLNLRLIDAPGATAGINAAIASPIGLISTPDENFVYRYGSNLSDPDNRHPHFVNMYPAGGGDYMSNWLMWHMYHGYDATHLNNTTGDPRMRFYFYRQVSANSANTNLVRCAGQLPSIPANYPQSTGSSIVLTPNAGMPPGIALRVGLPPDPAHPAWGRTFCFPTNVGYWGRDHVDPQGIPPDNFSRTAWGAYPAGGRFDNNVNASIAQTQGMKGAGFQPIMMRSFVQFMRAEAATYLGTTGVARALFQLGIENSFDDVRAWSVNGQFGTSGSASLTEAATINSFYQLNYAGTFTTPVVVATTANIATLAGNITIDGVLLADGDRVLVKNQTTAKDNGIYVAASGAWIRATGSDEQVELVNQAVLASQGTINKNTRWFQSVTGTVTVGTTPISWVSNPSYSADVVNYVNAALAAYDAQTTNDERMNYIAREYWISLFGNGVEAYNLYRRTGMPTGMQPTVNPSPGGFVRSFFYPAAFATRNTNIVQKTNVTAKIFWDTNTSNLDF